MPDAEEEAAPLLGFDAELELLGFVPELLGLVPALELGFAEELALSPAPLASEPVIRT